MCGRDTTGGILCEKCDKPRKSKSAATVASPGPELRNEAANALDPFPIADVVPFPVESASPAITSVVDLLVATGVPSILVGPDRSVKFVSEAATALFGASQSDLTLKSLEEKVSVRVGDLSIPSSASMSIGDQYYFYSLVPMSGGAGGAALVFRQSEPPVESENVFDALELAPSSEEELQLPEVPAYEPTVTDVVKAIGDRFMPDADAKGIRLEVDAHELEQRFEDHAELVDALSILMENALHYAPEGGEVVVGVRSMEHKGKPLLLFFVMDTGPLVSENVRQSIFDPSFAWDPASPERTGRYLWKTREFAMRHEGSVWVESRTGKACTFFVRVQPDAVR